MTVSDDEKIESLDPHDAMISAGMDDELGPGERAELDELLIQDGARSARARAFERVDEELRSLAAEPIDDDRLTTIFESLRARLGFDESTEPDSLDGERTNRVEDRPSTFAWRRSVSFALAAAAALALYLVFPSAEPATDRSAPIAGTLDPKIEDELVLVLGYGEDMSELGAITNDDLEIIEQLDLLDFLSAREKEGRG